jgi:hypothetical protein
VVYINGNKMIMRSEKVAKNNYYLNRLMIKDEKMAQI